jgi:DNA replication and repair protein RecF
MSITSLRLQYFRSYRDASFEFGDGVNIIVGPNASGKTNLLEAILVTCKGGSFRAKDTELMAMGAPWARLDGSDNTSQRTVKLLCQESGLVKKEFVIHDQKLSRLSMQKTIPVVLFEPNHLLLLHGSPDQRREYLDNLLEQTTPGYAMLRRNYRRALAQRNALLKRGDVAKNQLFAWNIKLSQLGSQVVVARQNLITELNQQIDDIYHAIVPNEPARVSLRYQATCDIEQYASSLLQTLERRQDTDIERGFTSVGPHREDMIVEFDGRQASDVASRGEVRTILLVLKIIELQLIEQARETKPILLLDDVFSELDGARRKALTEAIKGYQTFITTTDADVVVHHFMESCTIIPLG